MPSSTRHRSAKTPVGTASPRSTSSMRIPSSTCAQHIGDKFLRHHKLVTWQSIEATYRSSTTKQELNDNRATQLTSEIGAQRKRADQAEENVRREQLGRTRFMSESDRKMLAEQLKTIKKPTQPIQVAAGVGDRDSLRFARLLMGGLREAGFAVLDAGEQTTVGGGFGPGVQIRSAVAARDIAKLIGSAFEHAGVEGVRALDDDFAYLTGDAIEINVGYKPLEE